MSLATGQTILNGHYHLLRQIGEGGFARVWLAEDTARRLQVAIKEPRANLPGFQAADLSQRFERELRCSGALFQAEAPNVVRAIAVEQWESQPLLVMEYCEGGSLAERLRCGPLPVAEAVRITQELLAALVVVHAQLGWVHRDVKPANLLFTADGRTRLADFGLAQTGESGRSLGSAGAHPGTPAYMSPEQETTTGYLTGRSDLFSLGCVLFEMLTSRRYKDQRPGMLPGQLRPEVPAWLDKVVAKALEPDPWQRWQSAAEMAAAVQAGQAPGQPRRQKRYLWGMAGLAVVVLGASGLLLAQWLAPPPAAPAAAFTRAVSPSASVVARAPSPDSARQPDFALPDTAVPATALRRSSTATPANAPVPPTPVALPAGAPSIGATAVSPMDGMVLVYVPAGEFLMGSTGSGADDRANEQPQHRVYLDAFWIDRTEVTNEQYRKCAQAGACRPPSGSRSFTRESYYGNAQFASYPVISVSWQKAQQYCIWAGRRLPTEAEWEKAARGTDGRVYPWGNQPPDAGLTNTGMSVGDTAAVGSYPAGASPYGALDLVGNLWEVVADWYDGGYYARSPASNPPGPASGQDHVLRGGAWSDDPWGARAAFRAWVRPDEDNGNIGFRCASSVSP